MADLEKLVPPLELCQQIPTGSFGDSAFWYIWSEVDQKYILCLRGIGGVCVSANPCPCGMCYNYPAPTLEEVVAALYDGYVYDNVYAEFDGFWEIGCKFHPRHGGREISDHASDRGAWDALTLWLDLERKKHDK